ncbi:hypothetical protein E6P09_13330 [Haloferax mediterranei ATCC 33500]|uniref:Uncharacterized protein n=1 Tax=Haloferax mediterranei (strain ATCC 33500 / DSM 1411 / JCM 8866 / NBRC 14739 / NCIMB 2177 / R-4) TaxID=523841 RepID=I3R808_HALMT|nr:hypothetical protein [Haloferax mediterranei]AFK20368.1 hypothetical protein HFX_2690 [Haloferax mediterranei ATCC 33500]AHZ23733.1 hypothetical protein BM92_14260 [Haloferax mediterranei ATCC 33500]ELZ99223.1 hypothetical protein C439_15229 [Haloferax mediterranei ATCC 33500]MDX5986877.1 hypothetical protein [Haloferax mediterranei ATCC 33500]QCQ76201.1 hypothetical protein E6P09_13330 [Haloferax mediterranei ATCC 33500]
MKRRSVVVVLVVVLAVGGVGIALGTGFGPESGDKDASSSDFPTQTPTPTQMSSPTPSEDEKSDSTEDAPTSGESTPEPPFVFQIDEIEKCGQTCRDVTSTLVNQQDADATGVTVYSRIFVGNSTDADDEIWRGSEEVGNLPAGESYSTTRRVKLSLSEAFAVQQADGWITIQTTIETDEQTLTYSERRDVI